MLHNNDSCSGWRNGTTGFQGNQGAALALGDCGGRLNTKNNKSKVRNNSNSI